MGILVVESVNDIFVWFHLETVTNLVLTIRCEHDLSCSQVLHQLGGEGEKGEEKRGREKGLKGREGGGGGGKRMSDVYTHSIMCIEV